MSQAPATSASVLRPSAEVRPGVWAPRIKDPDGNWIELQSLPPR